MFIFLCIGGFFGCEEFEILLLSVKLEVLLENVVIDFELFEVGFFFEKFIDIMYIYKKKRIKLKISNIKCCNLKNLYCMIFCYG